MAGGRLEAEVQPRALTRSGLGGDGKPRRIGTEVCGDRDILPRDVISRKLSVPNAERIFFIRHALRAGFTIDEIFNLTKIDRWFLVQIKENVVSRKNWQGRKINLWTRRFSSMGCLILS